MAVVTRPGWEVDDANVSSDVLKARIPTKLLPSPGAGVSGSPSEVLTKSNISNGNYDVYKPGGLLQGDELIYSINASNNKLTIHNQSLFDSRFNQNTPEGKKQFESLNKSIKIATYDNSQLNTGTDPIRNQNFNNIKKSETYKSLANSVPPGTRVTDSPNQPPQNGGDQQAGADENAAVVAELKKESKEGTRKDYGNVQYPVDLNPAVQDCIKFSIFEYKAPGVQPGTSAAGSRIVSLIGGNPGFKDRKNILGTITLPIPGGINDSNSADWSSGQIDEFTRALANISGQTILGGGQQGADATGDEIKNSTSGGGKDLNSIIAAKAAGIAAGASNLISRQFGAVVNPNLELLFNGPSLRTFGFNFRMSPRSAPEARNIRKIIRFFKQAMSVKRSNSSLLLKAPHTFAISYVTSNKQHPYLNKFKECALTVCNVNYTPDGTYMTYKGDIDDRSMTAYELSLTFQEIEPLFDDDYGNEKEITSIGF
jgi:hypothetical protein